MAAIYSNGGNRWNILGFNFTKRDALSSVYKISVATALSLTACDRPVPASLFPSDKPTDLSRLLDNLPQADKINHLRQACEISGSVDIGIMILNTMHYENISIPNGKGLCEQYLNLIVNQITLRDLSGDISRIFQHYHSDITLTRSLSQSKTILI